jgi:hypothetical protein
MAAQDPLKTSVAKNANKKAASNRRQGRGKPSNGKAAASPAHHDESRRQSRGGASRGSSSSAKPALWFALILVNMVLGVLLIPTDLVNNPTITNAMKVVSVIAAASAFKTALAWFRKVFAASLNRWWFKLTMVIAFLFLGTLNVLTKVPVIPLYPIIDPGVTLAVDGVPKSDYSGVIRVRLQLAPYVLKVETPPEKGKPREYEISWTEVLFALLRKYNAHLSPLYIVDLKTKVPKIEIEIRKDGDFDRWFLSHEQRPVLFPHTSLKVKGDTKNVFVWQASDSVTGSADKLYLPPGQYTFTPYKDGCKDNPITIVISGVRDEPYLADFRTRCPLH